jgi:ABC-type protease/lipase transport system fused ATPase/permease subunit
LGSLYTPSSDQNRLINAILSLGLSILHAAHQLSTAAWGAILVVEEFAGRGLAMQESIASARIFDRHGMGHSSTDFRKRV